MLRLLKRLVSVDAALVTADELAVLAAVDAVVAAEVAADVAFERRLDAAEETAFEAAVEAADLAAEVIELRSRLETLLSELSTVLALLEFTRFFEPEMRPLTNDLALEVVVLLLRPLMLVARVARLVRFEVLVRSSLPSVLYWV